MNDIEKILGFAKRTALEAGAIVTEIRNAGSLSYSKKSDNSLVSEADLRSDRHIQAAIARDYPNHRILSEEDSNSKNYRNFQGANWIIDPLDGTTNFAQGDDQFAVSMALALDGQVVLGVVHAPELEKTFSAVLGGGAYLNDTKISSSPCTTLEDALIGTGFPPDRSNLKPLMGRMQTILESCRDLRRIGAPALDICRVADGRLDGFFEDLQPWDFAAAALIAREAGALTGHIADELPNGVSADLYGQGLVVAAPEIFHNLRALLKGKF
jgi:myo-inositol-1(or 4)-monophosphatase